MGVWDILNSGKCTKEDLKNAYVKLYYIPPKGPRARPVNCKQIKITRSPEITIKPPGGRGDYKANNGLRPGDFIGIDLQCSSFYTEGAGGIMLFLQVGSYIEWEVEFTTVSNSITSVVKPPRATQVPPRPVLNVPEQLNYHPVIRSVQTTVRETHRVYVSFPMPFLLRGPRMALMALIPGLPVKGNLFGIPKLSVYATQIWAGYRKLREIEKLLAWISALTKGLCAEDIRAMEVGLKTFESGLKIRLQQLALWDTDDDCIKNPLLCA